MVPLPEMHEGNVDADPSEFLKGSMQWSDIVPMRSMRGATAIMGVALTPPLGRFLAA